MCASLKHGDGLLEHVFAFSTPQSLIDFELKHRQVDLLCDGPLLNAAHIDRAESKQVLEELVHKLAALLGVVQRLHVVLRLAQYRTQLQLQLALLLQLLHASRDAVVIVHLVKRTLR